MYVFKYKYISLKNYSFYTIQYVIFKTCGYTFKALYFCHYTTNATYTPLTCIEPTTFLS